MAQNLEKWTNIQFTFSVGCFQNSEVNVPQTAWFELNADQSDFVQDKILSNYHTYVYAVSKIRISNMVYVGNSFLKTSFLKLVFHMEISFCRGFSFGLGRLSQMRKSL